MLLDNKQVNVLIYMSKFFNDHTLNNLNFITYHIID